jgi:hypothetical protein
VSTITEVREKGAAPKWVFTFGGGRADGSAADKALLGGKGAHLAEMSRLGLPVPPGFTISTDVCAAYYEHGRISATWTILCWFRCAPAAGLPCQA